MHDAPGRDAERRSDSRGTTARETAAEYEEGVLPRRDDEDDCGRDEQPVVMYAQHGRHCAARAHAGQSTFSWATKQKLRAPVLHQSPGAARPSAWPRRRECWLPLWRARDP